MSVMIWSITLDDTIAKPGAEVLQQELLSEAEMAEILENAVVTLSKGNRESPYTYLVARVGEARMSIRFPAQRRFRLRVKPRLRA